SSLHCELSTLTFWLRAPGMKRLTMRLIDGTSQCHQIDLHLDPVSDDWRLVTFPVDRFFSTRGTAEALKSVARYENWGGAKDGKWHGILKAMHLLVGKIENESKITTIWISGVTASIRASAFNCDFEGATALPAGWTAQGSASIDGKDAFQGTNALQLNRAA